jgi:hypothetical protein
VHLGPAGQAPPDLRAPLAVAARDGALARRSEARVQRLELFHGAGHEGDVVLVELDAAADGVALPWLAHHAGHDPHAVDGVPLESRLHAVSEAVAGRQQYDQHEDPPGHAQRGEHGAQPAPPQHLEDFAPPLDDRHLCAE